jgi:outer membrane protein insertion porin family
MRYSWPSGFAVLKEVALAKPRRIRQRDGRECFAPTTEKLTPKRIAAIYAALSTMLLLSACTPARYLAEEEALVDAVQLEVEAAPLPKRIAADLAELMQPQPNRRFLGLRLRLGIYQLAGEPRQEKGLRHWVKNKLGEPPVRYDAARAERSSRAMEKYLQDHGFFQGAVQHEAAIQDQRARLVFRLRSGPQYQVRALHVPPDDTPLGDLVRAQAAQSAIAPGKPYRLEALRRERLRLAQLANEQGFYGLAPNSFYYHLDTVVGTHELDVYLRIAPPGEDSVHQQYHIGQTLVYPQYFLDQASEGLPDTLQEGTFFFIGARDYIKPSLIRELVQPPAGALYARSLQARTLNRLLGLGVYQFVNLKYELRQEGDTLFLDRLLYLTPGLPRDFSAEIEANTAASNSLGSAAALSYTHRNLLRGAERLRLSLSSGVETQLGAGLDFINTLDLLGRAELDFPRLLLPVRAWEPDQALQPRTSISMTQQFQRRTKLFSLYSAQVQLAYHWQQGLRIQHELLPINASLVRLVERTPELEQRLAANSRLRESFNDYFILGALYRFSYSNQGARPVRDFVFFRGSLESAGNLAGLLAGWGPRRSPPREFLGLPFAQFLRAEADLRYNWFFGKNSLVARASLAGIVPYGNSTSTPYVRQFFVGGANSIRAYRFRALGPGSSDDYILDPKPYNDQTGDLKLELNLEYRFPLVSYLKGALFVDAGNIWLYNDPLDEQPGGAFDLQRFYRELAIGPGFGLRLDLSFFVLRFDLAAPIRQPYLPEGQRWAWQDPEQGFGSRAWRREKVVLNLALGYPF